MLFDEKIKPGIANNIDLAHFDHEEFEIVKRFSHEFFVTNGGGVARIANSVYQYFLVKPTQKYTDLFNFEKEIICVISRYSRLEPRTLDAFDYVKKQYQHFRLEKICFILIS
ncbi:hypothetical protein K0V43_20330, partial [Leptospira sp. id769339]|nr:hypothetical protein [Leptospira sp. id769339]